MPHANRKIPEKKPFLALTESSSLEQLHPFGQLRLDLILFTKRCGAPSGDFQKRSSAPRTPAGGVINLANIGTG
jgi:hypothetical protein